MVHLIARMCEILSHVEMSLRESMKIAQSQHARNKTGQVLHLRGVAASTS